MAVVREILIVDDHDRARDTLLGMVEHAGYAAVAFASPAGALARIAEERPALILLDMMMPDIDGAEFLRRLAAIPDVGAVPVVVVSAIGHLLRGVSPGDARTAGVVDVLPKPVSYTTLVETISRIIGPPEPTARQDG